MYNFTEQADTATDFLSVTFYCMLVGQLAYFNLKRSGCFLVKGFQLTGQGEIVGFDAAGLIFDKASV